MTEAQKKTRAYRFIYLAVTEHIMQLPHDSLFPDLKGDDLQDAIDHLYDILNDMYPKGAAK